MKNKYKKLTHYNDLRNNLILPEVKKNADRKEFIIVPGQLAPNGVVGMDNPIFKQWAIPNFNGWKYLYTSDEGNEVEVTVEIK